MKRNYLTIMTLILTSSLLLTPVHASITTYIWDTIHYVEGTGIDYPTLTETTTISLSPVNG